MTGNLLPPPHVLPFAAAAALSAAANGSMHYPGGMPYPVFAAAAAAAAAGGMGPPPPQHHLPPPSSTMVHSPSQHHHRPPPVVLPQGLPTSSTTSAGLGGYQHCRPSLVDGAVSPAAMGLVNGGAGSVGGQMASPYSTPGSASIAPDCYVSPDGLLFLY